MRNILPILVVFVVPLFFSASNILGYSYQGNESSNIYIVINVIALMLGVYIYVKDLSDGKFKISRPHFISLSIILCIFGIYFFETLLGIVTNSATQTFYYFVIWGIPSILMGIYFSKKNRTLNLIKYMEALMVIFTISSFRTLWDALTLGVRATAGGATYQYAGYMAAFAFGLNLYYIFLGNDSDRIILLKLKTYKQLRYIMLVLQFLTVAITGSRGPMVLILVYLAFIMIISNINIKFISRIIPVVIVGGILLIFFWPELMNIPLFERSWQRAFEFISISGINWEGTSGRGDIYTVVLEAIRQSPLYGYGVFGMWRVLDRYPHNLFLEILLQGGIILFIPFMVIGLSLLMKLRKAMKYNPSILIVYIIGLYPMVLLMFSGTYVSQGLFWFVLAFTFNYRVTRPSRKAVHETRLYSEGI